MGGAQSIASKKFLSCIRAVAVSFVYLARKHNFLSQLILDCSNKRAEESSDRLYKNLFPLGRNPLKRKEAGACAGLGSWERLLALFLAHGESGEKKVKHSRVVFCLQNVSVCPSFCEIVIMFTHKTSIRPDAISSDFPAPREFEDAYAENADIEWVNKVGLFRYSFYETTLGLHSQKFYHPTVR